jgi:hypothetical protein
MRRILTSLLVVFSALGVWGIVSAQFEDVMLARRARAARMFDEATELYRAGKFAAASESYQRADAEDPSMASLMQASRAAWRGGDKLNAARLSLLVTLRYSDSQVPALPIDISKAGQDVLCLPRSDFEVIAHNLSVAMTSIYVATGSRPEPKKPPIPPNPF